MLTFDDAIDHHAPRHLSTSVREYLAARGPVADAVDFLAKTYGATPEMLVTMCAEDGLYISLERMEGALRRNMAPRFCSRLCADRRHQAERRARIAEAKRTNKTARRTGQRYVRTTVECEALQQALPFTAAA